MGVFTVFIAFVCLVVMTLGIAMNIKESKQMGREYRKSLEHNQSKIDGMNNLAKRGTHVEK